MPALPTTVTDYINSVKNSLSVGSDLGSNLRGAAQNYVRAQDMATVLDLLQDYGLSQTGLQASATGTVRTVVDTAIFTAGSQVGNVVVFTNGNLDGQERRIVANTTTTLTLEGPDLSEAPTATTTYNIRGGVFDEFISDLREAKGRADSPAGDPYGSHALVIAAVTKGITTLGGTVPARSTTKIKVHPGGQPGENIYLAYIIGILQGLVVAF